MSIIQSTAKSGAGGFYDYPIEQSLRFDGTGYLSRTPSTAGSRNTWTWSGWVKSGDLGVFNALLECVGPTTPGTRTSLMINNSNQLQFFTDNTSTSNIQTSSVYRDASAWYHIVVAVDTTQSTASNRVKFYVNGEQLTDFAASSYPAQYLDTQINNSYQHTIFKVYDPLYGDGYLANIQFIDGQALNASYFGETKSGVWIPKAYTGSYGTNGFRLAFNLSDFNTSGSAVSDPYGSATNLPDGYVADASGSGNHWQVN